MNDQRVSRVLTRDALACAGVLQIVETVPDQAPDIELVVEDAGAALAIAIDRRGSPFGATWSGDAVAIERLGDRTGRLPGGKILEDAQHDCAFCRIDHAPAANRLATGVE